MYKLYGSKKSRAFRVLWALEEMGLEYEYVASAPRSDEIRAMNPSGKIPVLMVDDEVIIDSVAIIQFLADKHGLLTFPAGTVERAHQDGFMQFACDEMDGVLWTAARNTFILPEEKRVPAIKPTLKWEYSRSMKTLATRLGEREYLMGDTFTVADIITAHCATWGKSAGFELSEPTVLAYVGRVVSRPAYLRASAL
ncbi:MAG: glutathione S-transferase family protein [Alphaproteobacteria bacterium]|nr:glutathione S-transferase family protein [Alphaproteobacteria bacterium]